MLIEKTFDLGSLKINFSEGSANGMPLVLLHGAIARWQELNPLITELEQHWHIYACDLRGHGKSRRATSYRAVDMFPDTATFIRDCIGAPTVLIGHSGGAIAAMGVAIQIPGLIRRLILLDPRFISGKKASDRIMSTTFFGDVHIHDPAANSAGSIFRVIPGQR